jgi:predicted CXXCH cytochrome family protein
MKRSLLFFALLFFIGTSVIYSQSFYLGVGTPADLQNTSCASCHSTSGITSPIYNDWITTRHSVAQDSASSSFYGYSCLKCHNTGWDITIDNYGADEYVDSTNDNGYVVTDQVNWDRVKNVQCEQCHGPLGTDARVLDSGVHFSAVNTPNYEAELCGQCHQDSHHPQYEEWSVSKHSTFPSFIPNWTDRSVSGECYKCHHAQDYVAFIRDPIGYDPYTFEPDGDLVNVDCVTCHDPHSNQFPSQLRKPITGSHVICDDCHTVGTDEVDIYHTPHHTTSEALSGTPNFGYQYPGETYENSAHTFAATERCINCHVFAEGEGEFGSATGHTFLPRTEACAAVCHTTYWDDPYVDPADTSSWFNYRNVQHVTDSLMIVLEVELMQLDPDLGHDELLGVQYNAALYNLESVQNAGSEGVHNTKLMQKLLVDAIEHFDPNDVEIEEGLPIQYQLSQNFPNPFNPSTEIKFSIPEQSIVKLVIYDAIGNEIETLLNEDLSSGNYKVKWNASGLASGVYLYRLQTDNFVATKKMILMR